MSIYEIESTFSFALTVKSYSLQTDTLLFKSLGSVRFFFIINIFIQQGRIILIKKWSLKPILMLNIFLFQINAES